MDGDAKAVTITMLGLCFMVCVSIVLGIAIYDSEAQNGYARMLGMEAAMDSQPESACPYSQDSAYKERRRQWLRGYNKWITETRAIRLNNLK